MNPNNADNGLITLKPNKPEFFDGKRDLLHFNALLYTTDQYLTLLQLN